MNNKELFFKPETAQPDTGSQFIATPSNKIADNLSKANEKLGLTTKSKDDDKITLEYNHLFLKATSDVLATLKPSTSKALDILGSRIEAHSLVASISVSDFMKARGIKDRKQAKVELKEAGRLAAETLITYDTDRLTKNERNAYKKRGIEALEDTIRLAERWALSTNGIFYLKYSEEYAKLALAFPPMIYHRELARINDNKAPAAYYLGRKLTELMNMRRVDAATGDKPESLSAACVRVSIPVLLSIAEAAIPSEEEVAKSNRAYKKRIIDKLESNLDALAEIGSWEYCRSTKDGGETVPRKEAGALPFQMWKELLIRFSFIGYLDELKRREAVAEAARKAIVQKPQALSTTIQDGAAI